MKNYKIYFIALFISGAFSLQSMNSDQAEENNETKIEQPKKIFNPSPLKRLCIKKVLMLSSKKQISIEQLAELPEDIINCIGYFNYLNLFLEKSKFAFHKLIPHSLSNFQKADEDTSKCINLVRDIRILFDQLIDSQSAFLITFASALKEILEDDKFIMNPDCQHFSASSIIDTLEIIKQMLVLADSEGNKAIKQDPGYLMEYLDNSATSNKIATITLLYQLRKLQAEDYENDKLLSFRYAIQTPASTLDFAKYLYDLLNITQEDLIKLLTDREHQLLYCAIRYSGSSEKVNYVFELMEKHEIDIQEFINKEYQLEDVDPITVPLIDAITHICHPDIVKLLISKGADLGYKNDKGENILTIAQKTFKLMRAKYLLGLCSEKEYNNIEAILEELSKQVN